MLGTPSARSILESRIDQILTHLHGVRDGSPEAIHDARVATRRSREAVTIAGSAYHEDQLADVADTLRCAGRALGAVRDADVMHELLANLDSRVPVPALAASTLRAALARERQRGRRQVIKDLEKLDLARIPQQLRRARRSRAVWSVTAAPWRTALGEHLVRRLADVRAAVQHGSGVYFPNRTHATRIAIKKLRYSVELSEDLRLWHVPKAVRRLKRAQETLGSIRDRQMLFERLKSEPAPAADIEPTIRFLDAEIGSLHELYVGMRPGILETCARVEAVLRTPSCATRAIAAVAVPSLVLLGRELVRSRLSGRVDGNASRELRVRVHVPGPAAVSDR